VSHCTRNLPRSRSVDTAQPFNRGTRRRAVHSPCDGRASTGRAARRTSMRARAVAPVRHSHRELPLRPARHDRRVPRRTRVRTCARPGHEPHGYSPPPVVATSTHRLDRCELHPSSPIRPLISIRSVRSRRPRSAPRQGWPRFDVPLHFAVVVSRRTTRLVAVAHDVVLTKRRNDVECGRKGINQRSLHLALHRHTDSSDPGAATPPQGACGRLRLCPSSCDIVRCHPVLESQPSAVRPGT